jgi:hypothetical protein
MIAAASKEIGDLIKIGTFATEPPIPSDRKAIGSRIVFKVNQQRCALLYYTVRAPRGWDRILLIFSKDFGSSTMRFFLFE